MFTFTDNRKQDSTYASQGGGRGLSLERIATRGRLDRFEHLDALLPRLLELTRG